MSKHKIEIIKTRFVDTFIYEAVVKIDSFEMIVKATWVWKPNRKTDAVNTNSKYSGERVAGQSWTFRLSFDNPLVKEHEDYPTIRKELCDKLLLLRKGKLLAGKDLVSDWRDHVPLRTM